MIKLTRAQRVALKRLFDREPIITHEASHEIKSKTLVTRTHTQTRLTYRGFRKQVMPMFMGDGAVLIKWGNMWLGIETDGYTHS